MAKATLRGPTCGGDRAVGGVFVRDAAKDPARFWIGEHSAELARLERGELKPALP